MSQEDVVEYYTGIADTYDETIFRDQDYVAYEKIPRWIIESLPIAKANILDLGCGTGLSALGFFEAGCTVTGIDITPRMIEHCQRLPFEKLLCRSLEEPLPSADSQFDAAVMIGVMEFIQDSQKLFNEVARVLTSGALFGLTLPTKLSAAMEEKLAISTYHPSDIEKQLIQAGFSVERTELFQGFVYREETVQYCGFLLKKL